MCQRTLLAENLRRDTQLADIMGEQVGVLQELNLASSEVADRVVQTNKVSDSVATQGAQLSQQVVVLKTLADDLSSVMVRSS